MKPVVKFLLFLILAALFVIIGNFFHLDQEQAQSFFIGIPLVIAGPAFIALYVVSTSLIWVGPKDILRLAAVFIYGPYVSTVLVTIAEMLNLPIMFFLSRRLGRAFVANRLKGNMQKLDMAVGSTGYGMVFFLRLLLLVPMRFLDLGFGLTKMSFWRYFAICLLATPLRIFGVQFFLSLGMDTMLNSDRLARYLTDNPMILGGTAAYFAGSLLLLQIIKARMKNSGKGSAA